MYIDFNLDKPREYKEDYNESIGEQFAGSILSNLNVNNIRNTNIIKISFQVQMQMKLEE